MVARGLGSAKKKPEGIDLELDPQLKSCRKAVCSNGGAALQHYLGEVVEAQLDYSDASSKVVQPGRGGGGRQAGGGILPPSTLGAGPGANGSGDKMSKGAPSLFSMGGRGGSRLRRRIDGAFPGPPLMPALSRMDRI